MEVELFKQGKKDKILYWKIEVAENKYRCIHGELDGAKVTTEWTTCFGKNVGRANETSNFEQAILEAESKVRDKKDKGYCDKIAEIERPFKVTLAKKWEDYKNKVEYPVLVFPKLDGQRAYIKKGKIFARSNKEVTSCDHLLEDINLSLIFDGELYNHDLKDDFNKIVSLTRTEEAKDECKDIIKFYAFDLIGDDRPYEERHRILTEELKDNDKFVVVPFKIANNEQEVEQMSLNFLKEGYEGAMIRWGNDGYIQERTNKLLKAKFFQDAEFRVVEILEGRGKKENTVGKWVLETQDGRNFEVGPTGTDEENKEIWSNKESYKGKWATIKYQSLTPDGIPRFGNFKNIRHDL